MVDSPDSDRGMLSGVSQWLTLQILTEACSLESHSGHTIPVNPYSIPVQNTFFSPLFWGDMAILENGYRKT